ncbi:MAG TPA: alpha-amylase family glycosyl hydrolase [Thermoanaerobaculia bacterium]|nr:alpha-amylase family glycosyl hydrolase [Thermoanaerobaculia bacterium]
MRTLPTLLAPLATLLALLPACAGGSAAPPAPPTPPAVGALASPEAPPAKGPVQWQHDWARGAVFYEVFVRSFADSDGDGIGDIRGLTSKLDYLNDGNPKTVTDLGVDALWLMPVFESPSYHGYDVVDYERIDREYGTAEDFQRFLDEAHRRGIRVIVDFVMNHSSSQHPWFVESASSPASGRRDWYVWRADDPRWTQPWGGNNRTWHEKNGAYYYGVFWGGMPDLNFSTPAVREEMKRLATLWLGRGLDGFRLDATRHLFANGPGAGQNDQPETHVYLKELSAAVRQAKPDAMLVGENWTETPEIAAYYGSTDTVRGGDELPMNFNFPLASAILAGVNAGDAQPIAEKLTEMAELYPAGIIDTPFLTNHDMVRAATQLGADPGERVARSKMAAAVLLTLPGAPFLYYGEEVGLQNGGPSSSDELKRTPMPWDASPGGGFTTGKPWYDFAPGRETNNVAAQAGDPDSLLTHYRHLIRARHNSDALRTGELELRTPATTNSPLLAFLRKSGKETVLVVHNLGSEPVQAGPYEVSGRPDPLFASAGVGRPAQAAGGWTFQLPGRTSGVWVLR